MSKLIRLSFNVDGDSNFQRIIVLPIADNESKKIVSKCDCDAEKAIDPLYEKIANESSEQLMDFVFTVSDTPTDFIVSDDETEDEIYSDDEFNIVPSRGIMSMDEISDNYPDEEDKEEKEAQEKYLKGTKLVANDLHIAKGFSKAWEGLINNSVSSSTFAPTLLKESLKASGAKAALLVGESEISSSTITFKIKLEDDEEFDVEKLDFINFDDSYDDYSPVLNNLLERDMVSMNAIIYDGKMYFAGHNDFDCDENNGDTCCDFVNEDIESENPNVEINESANVQNYRTPDDWPKEAHEFLRKKIEQKGGSYFYDEDEKQIRKCAIKFGINPDDFVFEAKFLWEKNDKERDQKRDKVNFIRNLREEYNKKIKSNVNHDFQEYLLRAKTEYKDDPEVQLVVKEIENSFAEKKENERKRILDDLHIKQQQEIVKMQAEADKMRIEAQAKADKMRIEALAEAGTEKAQAEADAMRLKVQMLKDEAEYIKLKEEKNKRDKEERERKLKEAKERQEEKLRELKKNWPIIKKCLIGFFIFVVVLLTLLLLFGQK